MRLHEQALYAHSDGRFRERGDHLSLSTRLFALSTRELHAMGCIKHNRTSR